MLSAILTIVALIFAACKLRAVYPRLWRLVLLASAVMDIMTMSQLLGACG